MQRGLIFDFGGVLMKTVDYSPRHMWDKKLSLPNGAVEQVVHGSASWLQAQTGQISVADYWADVANQLTISSDQVKQLAHDFYSGDVLDQELVALIQERKNEGHTIALLSNDSIELESKLKNLKIDDLFDHIVISARIGVMKPHAEAYQAILKQLKRPAEETIFIDDRLENVEGAQRIGIYGIHYTTGMNLSDKLAPILVQ